MSSPLSNRPRRAGAYTVALTSVAAFAACARGRCGDRRRYRRGTLDGFDASEGRHRAEDRLERYLDGGDGAVGKGTPKTSWSISSRRMQSCAGARCVWSRELAGLDEARAHELLDARKWPSQRSRSSWRDGASMQQQADALLEANDGVVARAALMHRPRIHSRRRRIRSDGRSARDRATAGHARPHRRRLPVDAPPRALLGTIFGTRETRMRSSRGSISEAARAQDVGLCHLDRHARVRRPHRFARSRRILCGRVFSPARARAFAPAHGPTHGSAPLGRSCASRRRAFRPERRFSHPIRFGSTCKSMPTFTIRCCPARPQQAAHLRALIGETDVRCIHGDAREQSRR